MVLFTDEYIVEELVVYCYVRIFSLVVYVYTGG
jgi:hypothetical protein